MSRTTKWLDHALYPDYADRWESRRLRQLLAALTGPNHRLLDYGAGRGAVSELNFRGHVARVAGVDPEDAVLGNPFLDEAKVLPLPSGRIPYEAETFDLVLSVNVLEHVAQPSIVFQEVFRVLKAGGLFVSQTPNKWHYVPILARLTPHRFHVLFNRWRGREAHDTFPTLYRCNTRGAVRRYARDAGFGVVAMDMWEGRPEYLRMAAPLYIMGYAYEKLVNASKRLEPLRCVLVSTLRKPPSE